MMACTGCKQNDSSKESDISSTTTVTMAPTTQPSITPPPEPTNNTPTPTQTAEPEETKRPTKAPVSAKDLLTFQVQPITITEDIKTPFMSKDEFPKLDGSTANIPLGEAVYSYLTKATKEEAKQDLVFYKTPDSYRRLMSGEVDILFVYEVSGEDSEIMPFQRPAASGSQTLMEKLAVPADQIMVGPQVVYPQEMGDLIDILATYNNERNALGYSVYFYANYMYSQPGLKFVAIDGVMPDNQSIQTGDYPYVNDFYVVIRKEEEKDSKARQLYEWMTSKEAQTILSQAGYVPVVDVDVKSEEVATPKDVINGTLDIKDDQYVILHNITPDGIYKGDSLLDRNLNTVMTFSGKSIVTGMDLGCSNQDILQIKSYDKEILSDVFELYSLAKKQYLTDQSYDSIEFIHGGYYKCTAYDYKNDRYRSTVFNSSGLCILDVTNGLSSMWNITFVGSNLIYVYDYEITAYDQEGHVVGTGKIDYPNLSYFVPSHYNGIPNELFKIYLYDPVSENEYCLIYDETIHPISYQCYEKKLPKSEGLWVRDCVYGSDDHFYVHGMIDDTLYIVKDDGTIIYSHPMKDSMYWIIMNNGWFRIYDEEYELMDIIQLDGKKLDADENDFMCVGIYNIITKQHGFDAYDAKGNLCWQVEDENYEKYSITQTGWEYDSPFLTYDSKSDTGETISKATYFGILEFDGRIETKALQGQYYIINYLDFGKRDQLILDHSGAKVFVAKDTDYITGGIVGNQIYAYVESGNYEGIIDSSGNYIFRRYSSRLAED